jgi:UDP-N-acetylglucosamine 2-epimerase (non-hydrolysing)
MLNFPSISLRTSTERPEVLDKGAFIIGGVTETDVMQAVEMARLMHENQEKPLPAVDYNDDNVSIKVAKIIQSYTKIINKNTWKK